MGRVMQFVVAVLVIVVFALFMGVANFLLKDSRKTEHAARLKAQEYKRELETCRKENH